VPLFAAASLLATLLTGAPHAAVPAPPQGTMHPAMPPGVPTGPDGFKPSGHPDLLERVHISAMAVRGHVGAAPTGIKDAFSVHVDRWLKGQGPTDLVVDFGHERPLTPEGGAELLFLAPSPKLDGGSGKGIAPYLAMQATGEYYSVPDGLIAPLDQALTDAVAGAPEDKVLMELARLSPSIAEPAVARLALLASKDPKALETAEATIKSPETALDARVLLVTMVGSRLPVATVAALAGAGEEHLRLAALESLGRMAANEPTRRTEALPVLLAAASDPSPKIKLTAGLALANLGDARALAPLDAILAGTDAPLRAEATRGLARLAEQGNTDAYDHLEKLKADPDVEVKSRATHLLAPLGARPASATRPPWLIFGAAAAVVILALLALNRRRRASR
jgi:hypothetical protein